MEGTIVAQNVSICWAALCCNTTAAVQCPPIQRPCHRPRHGSGAAQATWLGGCALAAVTDARGGFAAVCALTAQAVQGGIPQAAGRARQAVGIRACTRGEGLEHRVWGQAALQHRAQPGWWSCADQRQWKLTKALGTCWANTCVMHDQPTRTASELPCVTPSTSHVGDLPAVTTPQLARAPQNPMV